MYVNISTEKPYLTQLNNRIAPRSACNVTSVIMGLVASEVEFDYPQDMQPEDYLASLLLTDDAYQRMNDLYPWARKGGYEPYEVHAMLEWAINTKLVGQPVDHFTTNGHMSNVLHDLLNGYASLMSGYFTSYGHIVCVVGFESYQDYDEVEYAEDIDLRQVTEVIVDDPYGDYHSGYSNRNGDNIVFPFQQFNELTKDPNELGSKWVHSIGRY